MNATFELIQNITIVPFLNVSPELTMLYYQICIMKCYFCLYIFRKENLEHLFPRAFVLIAFYKAFIQRKADLAWFLTTSYAFFLWLGAWITCLEMTTLVTVSLNLKGFEFFVDCLLVGYLHVLMKRSNDVFTIDYIKSGRALLWIAIILLLPYCEVLRLLANHHMFIYFFVAGTFYIGLEQFTEGKWAYLLLAFVFLNQEPLIRFCWSLFNDIKIPLTHLFQILAG